MATKTITIDLEAYKRLKDVQKPNESFSETIKRVVRKPFDVKAWLKIVEQNQLSDSTIQGIERVVANRKLRSSRER